MKKLLLLASAALLAACSESDLSQIEPQVQSEQSDAVSFDVYALRNITRGGGQLGDLNNKNIGANGFGVFGYYTDGDVFGPGSKPNFMYNQQVVLADPSGVATLGENEWIYEPVKYWPNEYGSAAVSDGVDCVSFFAYAPWTLVEPTTGKVIVPDTIKSADSISVWQNKNIVSINKNSDLGDPIVKYRVDTDPATSVDLLWGVAAPSANDAYGPIDGSNGSSKQNAGVKINVGEPFLNLVKPNNPAEDKLTFNLKHSLAKVKFTIDYIDDAETPEGSEKIGKIDQEQTRIYVRQFKMNGWATEGALDLNNQDMAGEPNWKAFDGKSELEFDDELTFFDGRKDDSEGKKSGEAKTEKPQGLNPNIIENYDATETTKKFGAQKNYGVAAMTKDADGNILVKAKPDTTTFKRKEKSTVQQKAFSGTQLLFGGDPTKNDGFFYIIPRNSNEGVNIEIAYDVETIDTLLASIISDGLNYGISVPNVIRKSNIFGEGVDFKAGYQYIVNLHLGMTSVKIDADVQPWIETDTAEVNLPKNQGPQRGHDLAYAKKGDVIYSDGKIHRDTDTGEMPDGVTPVALVVHIGATGDSHYTHGLALALEDEGEMNWDEGRAACQNKPAIPNAYWDMPALNQWNEMVNHGAGSYTALRDCFESVGGTNMLEDSYWTRTTVSGDVDSKYYKLFADPGGNGQDDRSVPHRVRACLAF